LAAVPRPPRGRRPAISPPRSRSPGAGTHPTGPPGPGPPPAFVHRTDDSEYGAASDARARGRAQTGGMDNGAAVMVRDLRKSYRDVAAVRGIDLEIKRGEGFALHGPNGAGKTTTVEILEGFRRRDHGTVGVLGEDPARAGRAWRARIGIVLQLGSTGPELTVVEIVRHFAAFYPASRRAEEAIALVGLTSKAGSRIGQLSGGQT